MPMGLKNAPAIHQQWVTAVLHPLIGKICHLYLDDIVIWSNSIHKHEQNAHTVLQALRDVRLYVNPDKTHLFCTEIDFLGPHISSWGKEADTKKVEHILSWSLPKTATNVEVFIVPHTFLQDSWGLPGLNIGWCASQFFESCGGIFLRTGDSPEDFWTGLVPGLLQMGWVTWHMNMCLDTSHDVIHPCAHVCWL